ncbi:bifunctional phosphoglucose/phosphomannose isomerase [bacterium]|nr:MAG: bifunctional phosphoglucose/phosphomannose isomerase [bacterium]RKZ20280.1 MAG: bifunctional phosphoglucose/phosphomannose isomerase [bacterium]
MIELIDILPDDVEKALELEKTIDVKFKGIKNVCIGGMGGSAIGGDLISSFASQMSSVPVFVVRDYELPRFVDSHTLFIGISYSGNTEETVSLYKKARKKKAKMVVITSNGMLEDMAVKDNVFTINIPKGYPPRAAIAYLFFPLVFIMRNSGLLDIKQKELKEVVSVLKSDREKAKQWAEEVSLKVKEKVPFIYAEEKFMPVAKRWVTQINENSKALAHFATIPELDHNEIVGWENPKELLKRFFIIFFRSDMESERMKKRIDITIELLESVVGEITQVRATGEGYIAQAFSLIQKGDYLSYYLAMNYGVEPYPVKRIEELKRRMAE